MWLKCSLNSGKLNHHCLLSAKLKIKLTYISFISEEIPPLYGNYFRSFLVLLSIFVVLYLRSILLCSISFLDGALEHELLINHILLIFKNYLYKARENKVLNYNILKNYLTKIRDLEADLEANDKYNSNIL